MQVMTSHDQLLVVTQVIGHDPHQKVMTAQRWH
jgi:hypothetical protein